MILVLTDPLGAPRGPATKAPSTAPSTTASLYTRSFASGTRVAFDGGGGNGTIWWANGKVQTGPPGNPTANKNGCAWEAM